MSYGSKDSEPNSNWLLGKLNADQILQITKILFDQLSLLYSSPESVKHSHGLVVVHDGVDVVVQLEGVGDLARVAGVHVCDFRALAAARRRIARR